MLSLQAYKLVHLLGAFLVLTALGGLAALGAAGATGTPARRLAGILHGVGLVVLLVGGFGALARGGFGFDAWVSGKLAIWLLLAAGLGVARRLPRSAGWLLVAAPLLAALAGWLALFKPGI